MNQPLSLKVIILSLLIACSVVSISQVSIISYGSNWKYWANTQANFPTGWTGTSFDDAAWPSGNGELGYGDGDEATCIPSGGGGTLCTPSGNKWPAYYFRKVINIPDPSVYSNFTFNVERDDGYVVYVNGVEVGRDNMPAFPAVISYGTSANSAIEDAVISFTVASSAFVSGNNIIAVEIHQATVSGSPPSSTSSDISFNLELLGNDAFSATLTRGPYLQVGTQTSITLRWRTTTAQNSRVELGTVYGTYPIIVNDAANVTDHIVTVTGFTPDTKYFYRIGNSVNMQLANNKQFFTTNPPPNTTRKIRITAFGDCGRNNPTYQDNNLANYLNYLSVNNIDAPDAWILMGDNAYSSGTETEYSNNFFNIYGNNILRNHKLYPAPGNHDYGNNSGNKTSRSMPYHTIFSVPQNGEAGGVASNKQNYYSYDVGNVHFLSLDSYGVESDGTDMQTSGTSAMKSWIAADMAANTKKWTIAYWHHPPYTKSSHNSDTESDLVNIRQNFITFLEARGVDLIICGHSHAYERGYLLRNFTGAWTTFNAPTHAVSTSSATYNSNTTCPYVYNTSPANHGTVYVVAGSVGASGSTNTNFGAYAMPFAVNDAGIFYFEVEDNRLDAQLLRRDGSIFDRFTIMKDVNTSNNFNVVNGSSINLTASWPQSGNYTWTNTSGTTRTVNVTPPNSTTTVYTVTDAFGCIADQFNVTANGTLPVSLLNYNVRLNNNKVDITWSTNSETNNKHFSIERSANGIGFISIGKVEGAGNSTDVRQYAFTDFSPLAGISYYRLAQTDLNDHKEYLQVKKIVNNTGKDFDIKAMATGNGIVTIQINSTLQNLYQLKIFDLQGRELKNELISCASGLSYKNILIGPGMHIIEIMNNEGEKMSQKILIN